MSGAQVTGVVVRGAFAFVLGRPSADHDCDAMGCGSAEDHVVWRGPATVLGLPVTPIDPEADARAEAWIRENHAPSVARRMITAEEHVRAVRDAYHALPGISHVPWDRSPQFQAFSERYPEVLAAVEASHVG